MARKIYCVGPESYINWMEPTDVVNSIASADLICFTGGEDASPKTAREKVIHPKIYFNQERDDFELKIWKECFRLNKKVIAICRSSQISSCLAGGKLVRDQESKYFEHEILTHDNQVILSGSSHHNAMWPWNLHKDKFKLLGWAVGTSRFHEDCYGKECVNGVVEGNKECEIILFREINTLAHQHHFEYCNWQKDIRYKKTLDYLRNQLDDFMLDKL